MKRLFIAWFGALALLAAGCGGGGSSGGGSLGPPQALEQQTIVVQMDQNGDNELDLLTLDISENPFVILECFYGMPGGDFRDVTPFVAGLAIDPGVSGALATYVGDSFGEDRAELDVTDTNGDPAKIVVFGIGGGQPNGLASLAAEILAVRPGCASPGDAVLIKGSEFGESPTVLFGDAEARVLRNDDTRIVCRVPDGLDEGDVTIDVDGATADFHVLAEGAPVVLHMSTGTATPGMLVFFIGARLRGASAEFWNGGTEPVAVEELRGGWCVGYMKVPEIAFGTYTIVIRNDAGSTGPCSPTLDVVEEGDPTIEAIEPEEQLPGRQILCTGTDLGPLGLCFLNWEAEDGSDLFGYGFANGYDRVHTWVPGDAAAGATYAVTIDFVDGSSTNAFAYTVGTPPPPEITHLEYDEGPAGSLVGIFGHALVGGGFAWPTVHFTADGVSHEALIYYAYGGYFGGGYAGANALQGESDDALDGVFVEVPRDLADGAYDVTVTVNGQTSNAVVFTVKDLPLTVTSMRPDSQGPNGPHDVVVITGTGFGFPDYDFVITDDNGGGSGLALFDPGQDPFADLFDVTVTWQGDGDALEGYVLWHNDREILVIPPGGWEDPLPVGEYTVSVTVEHEDGSSETVEAGTYTVNETDDSGHKPFPGNGIFR